MTCKEKYIKEHLEEPAGYRCYCPDDFNYADVPTTCGKENMDCGKCWEREANEGIERVAPAESNEPHILDSGDRTEFASGAVRDMREGKGRCDLLPMDVVAQLMSSEVSTSIFDHIYLFQIDGEIHHLLSCLYEFSEQFLFETFRQKECHMILEVAKHFEEGAKKYGDNNWRKGIPARCYIDSAIRHYLKYLRGDQDEPHGRAFCWNIMCCIWTCMHIPELNDYAKGDDKNETVEAR